MQILEKFLTQLQNPLAPTKDFLFHRISYRGNFIIISTTPQSCGGKGHRRYVSFIRNILFFASYFLFVFATATRWKYNQNQNHNHCYWSLTTLSSRSSGLIQRHVALFVFAIQILIQGRFYQPQY